VILTVSHLGGKKKSPYKWAYEHTQNLKEKTETLKNSEVKHDIEEYIKNISEDDYSSGYWTILKNISLAYCINPFGKILEKNNITNTVCLDLFSGCGVTPMKDPTKEKIEWTVGSPIITTTMTDYPFKKYISCDKNPESIKLLKKILGSLSKDNLNHIFHCGDANKCIRKIGDEIKDRYVFAFIDPTGFQWNWESMELLFNLSKFDILMNFQTSMVDRIGTKKEKEFFGPCASEVSEFSRDEKLKRYVSQIENRGLHVSTIRVGKDKTDRYYYHLLHISPRGTYKSIIETLKNKIERFSGSTIKRVWKDLHGYSRQSTLPVNNE